MAEKMAEQKYSKNKTKKQNQLILARKNTDSSCTKKSKRQTNSKTDTTICFAANAIHES